MICAKMDDLKYLPSEIEDKSLDLGMKPSEAEDFPGYYNRGFVEAIEMFGNRRSDILTNVDKSMHDLATAAFRAATFSYYDFGNEYLFRLQDGQEKSCDSLLADRYYQGVEKTLKQKSTHIESSDIFGSSIVDEYVPVENGTLLVLRENLYNQEEVNDVISYSNFANQSIHLYKTLVAAMREEEDTNERRIYRSYWWRGGVDISPLDLSMKQLAPEQGEFFKSVISRQLGRTSLDQ